MASDRFLVLRPKMPPWPLVLSAVTGLSCGRLEYDPIVEETDASASSLRRIDAGASDSALVAGPDVRSMPVTPDAPSDFDETPAVDAPFAPVDVSRGPDMLLAPVDVATDSAADTNSDAAPPVFGTASCVARYPNALFCEDFEDGLPTASRDYATNTLGGTAGISTTRVKQGARAFHGTVTAQAGQVSQSSLSRNLRPAIQSGSLYTRGHYFVPSGFSTNNWFIPMQIGKLAAEKISFELVDTDRIQLAINTDPQFPKTAPNRFPRDRWFCAEVAIQIAPKGGQGFSQLFIDGQKELEVPIGTGTLPPGGYDYFAFGIPQAAGLSANAEIFADDIVLSTTRVGCQ